VIVACTAMPVLAPGSARSRPEPQGACDRGEDGEFRTVATTRIEERRTWKPLVWVPM
jgi:hypothetical protein